MKNMYGLLTFFLKIIAKSKNFILGLSGKIGLSSIIPPEIVNDEFSNVIHKIASDPENKTFLEIGSSSGGGSTKVFLEAIAQREDVSDIQFCCVEVSSERFYKLNNFIQKYPFAEAFNVSSVPVKDFPSESEVSKFYHNHPTSLNNMPLDVIQGWRAKDIKYIMESGKNFNGIEAIKRAKELQFFDVCLIDGSEFTGYSELKLLIGSKYILLDDTEAYKCREAFLYLQNDRNYELKIHNPNVRNGFAVFKIKE
jgi:hypothetical protein